MFICSNTYICWNQGCSEQDFEADHRKHHLPIFLKPSFYYIELFIVILQSGFIQGLNFIFENEFPSSVTLVRGICFIWGVEGAFFLYIFQKCFLLNENLDERHQTQQCRWAEDRYQSNLCFITPEQCHWLIVSMPRRIDAVTHAKGGPCNIQVFRDTEFWVSVICKP